MPEHPCSSPSGSWSVSSTAWAVCPDATKCVAFSTISVDPGNRTNARTHASSLTRPDTDGEKFSGIGHPAQVVAQKVTTAECPNVDFPTDDPQPLPTAESAHLSPAAPNQGCSAADARAAKPGIYQVPWVDRSSSSRASKRRGPQ